MGAALPADSPRSAATPRTQPSISSPLTSTCSTVRSHLRSRTSRLLGRCGAPYRDPVMGMGNLGPDGRRRQRLVAGVIVAAMVLAAGAVLLGVLV